MLLQQLLTTEWVFIKKKSRAIKDFGETRAVSLTRVSSERKTNTTNLYVVLNTLFVRQSTSRSEYFCIQRKNIARLVI